MEKEKKEVENKIIAGMVITGVFLLLISGAASVQAAQMSVVPAYQEVSPGEIFTVDIYVEPEETEYVYGAQYNLYFNNTLLTAISQVNVSFLSQDGVDTWVKSKINNTFNDTHGMLEYGECRQEVYHGVTTPGVLARITFNASAGEDGESELCLHHPNRYLSDPWGVVIPTVVNNGNVSVKAGICGDVTDNTWVDMGDYGLLLNNVSFPGNPTYYLNNKEAGDVTGNGWIDMGDYGLLLNNVSFPGNPTYNLRCG